MKRLFFLLVLVAWAGQAQAQVSIGGGVAVAVDQRTTKPLVYQVHVGYENVYFSYTTDLQQSMLRTFILGYYHTFGSKSVCSENKNAYYMGFGAGYSYGANFGLNAEPNHYIAGEVSVGTQFDKIRFEWFIQPRIATEANEVTLSYANGETVTYGASRLWGYNSGLRMIYNL